MKATVYMSIPDTQKQLATPNNKLLYSLLTAFTTQPAEATYVVSNYVKIRATHSNHCMEHQNTFFVPSSNNMFSSSTLIVDQLRSLLTAFFLSEILLMLCWAFITLDSTIHDITLTRRKPPIWNFFLISSVSKISKSRKSTYNSSFLWRSSEHVHDWAAGISAFSDNVPVVSGSRGRVLYWIFCLLAVLWFDFRRLDVRLG